MPVHGTEGQRFESSRAGCSRSAVEPLSVEQVAVDLGLPGPERDAAPWVRFCVQAHVEQARHRLEQIAEAGTRWSFLEALVEGRNWPDRLVIALEQSLFQGVDRALYTAEADVSPPTASNDFRRLLDAGLVVQRGKGRTTRYVASESLRSELRRHVDEGRPGPGGAD
jgi:DNA-binding transcriptional ArsR family regulator